MSGRRRQVGVLPVLLPGCLGRLCGVRGGLVALRAAAALALAVALWMRSAGRGRSEDEAEDVDEDEDEVEVLVLGDAGYAVMRGVAGLRAAASAAATAGRMQGMSSGCRLGLGGWGGPAVSCRPGGPIWSAAVAEGGAGLRSSPSGLGWAGVLQCVGLCGLASAGGKSSRGLYSGARGVAYGFLGCVRGACAGHCEGRRAVGRGAPGNECVRVVMLRGRHEGCQAGWSLAGVCCCLGGWRRPVSRGPGARASVGVCVPQGGKWGERGMSGDCAGGVLCRYMCLLAAARLCSQL